MHITRIKFLLLLLSIGLKVNGQSADMVKIFDRTKTLLLSDTAYATEQSYRLTDDVKYDTDAKGYYQRLSADGNWPDINYHTDERSAWKPSWHLYRLMLLIREYHKNNDTKYLDAVHRAMKFWISNDFLCGNWWQNQINIPYAYSSILLMLDKDALPIETDFLNNVLVKRVQQKNPTGQNKIWQHDIEARIALLHHDEVAFTTAVKKMQSVIKVSTGEGIQPDYSFQQHGPMLQFGNYGFHFINSLLFWMTVSANTGFAFDADKQKIIFDYCSNGIRWSIYKGAMDITAIGRQFRKDAALKRGKTLQDDLNLLKTFDKSDSCKYAIDGLSDNCTFNGNKGFWRTDYMVQLKGNHYMMSVKTHGAGVSKVESINSENMKGAFLNDGVTLIQQSGKEYQDIEPVWNWTMLPGTTCDTTIKSNEAATFKTNNIGVFTGLVSDGANGASAMDYNRLGVKAKKSYFFVDGMLVALGAGIESADAKNVVTTVNQCFYKGGVVKSKSNSAQWVWHNNTGYFFIDRSAPAKTLIQKQSGAWNTIDGASGPQVLSDSVFTIYVPQATASSYAYVVKPETEAKQMDKLSQKLPVKVISNTAQTQAVESNSMAMAVFYQPGQVQFSSGKILADKPCMLICKKINGEQQLWVSDPSRSQSTVSLTINGKVHNVNLPQGAYLGSTVKVD
jgi:chondroitin AC lyase